MVGGYADDEFLCGQSSILLYYLANGKLYEGFGASNKYTPDAFWWKSYQKDYALVGGTTGYKSMCGRSCTGLSDTTGVVGSGSWILGASNKYTPDALWYVEDTLDLYLVVGGRNFGLAYPGSDGMFYTYLNLQPLTMVGSLGASNKYTPDSIWAMSNNNYYLRIGGGTANTTSSGYICTSLYVYSYNSHWDVGASNKYTPDGLWYMNRQSYSYVGRCTKGNNLADSMLNGMSTTNFNDTYEGKAWHIGASNKYTPDGLWYNLETKIYALASGPLDRLRCGGSCLSLNNASGYKYWPVGASNKYTPDEFAFVNPFSPRSYCTVSCEVYNHKMAGMPAFSVSSSSSYQIWSTGASLTYVPLNCSENYSENNSLSKTL